MQRKSEDQYYECNKALPEYWRTLRRIRTGLCLMLGHTWLGVRTVQVDQNKVGKDPFQTFLDDWNLNAYRNIDLGLTGPCCCDSHLSGVLEPPSEKMKEHTQQLNTTEKPCRAVSMQAPGGSGIPSSTASCPSPWIIRPPHAYHIGGCLRYVFRYPHLLCFSQLLRRTYVAQSPQGPTTTACVSTLLSNGTSLCLAGRVPYLGLPLILPSVMPGADQRPIGMHVIRGIECWLFAFEYRSSSIVDTDATALICTGCIINESLSEKEAHCRSAFRFHCSRDIRPYPSEH